MKLGIIGAMDVEVATLKENMTENCGSEKIHQGRVEDIVLEFA